MDESETFFNTVLVRYGEVTLKSNVVRRRLEKSLVDSIKYVLEREGIEFSDVTLIPGRIIIKTREAFRVADVVSKVFGVVSTSPCLEIGNKIEIIRKVAVNLARSTIKNNSTFAVRARRVKVYPITSKEIEKVVGADILEELRDRGVRVNLDNPDHTIYIEARTSKAYIYNTIIRGIGGMPAGSEGKIVALISGGIDSPVALWLLMRRGCKPVILHLNLGTYASQKVKEKIRGILGVLKRWYPRPSITYVEADYESILKRISQRAPTRYTCVLCKRGMLKVAEEVARRVGGEAIVTGESLGQVASQTLSNIFSINYGIKYPILRPLIAMDKEEIITLSRRIGLYEISSKQAVHCKLSPKLRGLPVTTRASLEVLNNLWEKLELEGLVKKAVEKMEVKEIFDSNIREIAV